MVLQRVEVEAPDVVPVDDDEQDHEDGAQYEGHPETTPHTHDWNRASDWRRKEEEVISAPCRMLITEGDASCSLAATVKRNRK